MRSFQDLPPALRTLGTGVLLGLPAVAPAFAATGDDVVSPRGMLLVGSLALLGIGLALKLWAIRDERNAEASRDAPDLRWWRNP